MEKIGGIADRLEFLCQTIPDRIRSIDETSFSFKPTMDKWSKKEILGHLIDSATNNHQRFVRTQFEIRPNIFYDQNKWNQYNYYQELTRDEIIDLWKVYNLHLAQLIRRIPTEKLGNIMDRGDEKGVSLAYVIEDYLVHLEHHLGQILG